MAWGESRAELVFFAVSLFERGPGASEHACDGKTSGGHVLKLCLGFMFSV